MVTHGTLKLINCHVAVPLEFGLKRKLLVPFRNHDYEYLSLLGDCLYRRYK